MIQFPFKYYMNEELVNLADFDQVARLLLPLLEPTDQNSYFEDVCQKLSILRSLSAISKRPFSDKPYSPELMRVSLSIAQRTVQDLTHAQAEADELELVLEFFEFLVDLSDSERSNFPKPVTAEMTRILLELSRILADNDLSLLGPSSFAALLESLVANRGWFFLSC